MNSTEILQAFEDFMMGEMSVDAATEFIREARAEQALALRGEPTMGMWDDFCSVFPVPFDDFLKAYKFMVGNMPALRGEPVAKEKIREIAEDLSHDFRTSYYTPEAYIQRIESAIIAGIALYAAPISGERDE